MEKTFHASDPSEGRFGPGGSAHFGSDWGKDMTKEGGCAISHGFSNAYSEVKMLPKEEAEFIAF